MRRPVRVIAATVLCLLVAAGCTSTSQGTPKPTPGSGSSGSEQSTVPEDEDPPEDDELPTNGAPNVDKPLNIDSFVEDPCRALDADQATALKVPVTGTPSDGPLGKICTWKNPETRGEAGIRMHDKNPRGLSGVYWAEEQGRLAYFEPLPPIEGYPAVANDGTDERDRGYCLVSVGVANDLDFAVTLQLSTGNIGEKDPCETAVMVAGMMLKTMKGES